LALAPAGEWTAPVVLTDAIHGSGLAELAQALAAHRRYLEESGQLEERRRTGVRAQVLALAAERVAGRVRQMITEDSALRALLARVENREADPLSATRELVDRVLAGEQPRATRPSEVQAAPESSPDESPASSSAIRRTP
jgi:LAO/AO transport system kinase